ncbi:uncharacterized protein LOC121002504 [Bufo bufo]|uniref:uncharacterized protein LOC121002504 n=1 Tax=Bufo bufo TaxID=8384 RepID=UPI001ABDB066|nr:uncharacterized protein LOC121002504 [Bufo bufo]
MSHLEEQQCNPQVKNVSKKKTQKSMTLVDYISDPRREESLVGLQYVVEIKMLDSDQSIVKCNLCGVKGKMATMKEHLSGINHIKVYMEKHYLSVLQSLKRSCPYKSQFAKLLKDYAKEIERAEGTQSVKIEYVSAADMKKEQAGKRSAAARLAFSADQKKLQVLDKRQLALNYSETFKILSREEATIVLNLTQQLSDQLEQYFLKYKGLDFLDSTMPDSISTKPTTEPKDLPPIHHENPHPISAADPGLNKEMQWHAEKPSSSSSVFWTDCASEDTRGMKRKPEMHEDVSHDCDVRPESSSASEFQDRTKRQHQEHDNCATMHSSLFYMNDIGLPQYRSAEVSSSYSSSIAATYTHFSVPETSGGELQMVKDTPPYSVSENSLNDISKTETVQKTESPNYSDTAETSNVDADRNTAVPGLSSSTSDSSHEPSSEKPASSHSQGKTSKTLSPDILQLLKGKDANTVTNILRTLSPFYPALQEVNLEILAQVLVNTGVLD